MKKSQQNTLQSSIALKTILINQQKDQREEIKQYFLKTWALYEKLFSLINSDQAYYLKPEPLRHPLIFYYGHTATFFVNKLLDAGLLKKRINEKFQFMFAVGVDEMDWDDLNETHYDWPSVKEAKQYRNKVKETVEKLIDDLNPKVSWDSDLWIILMGIQHQKIHLQTSAVIMRRLDIKYIDSKNSFFKECPFIETDKEKVPLNKMVDIEGWESDYELNINQVKHYGWDNEFGKKHIKIGAFRASQMLVSNGQYLQFVKNNGYGQLKYWSAQGRAWLKSVKVTKPLFWIQKNQEQNSYMLRTMLREIQMPWNWPVEVNNLQAQAFCNWKSEKTGLNYRLPTEDQYETIRNLIPEDQSTWQYQSVGNINLEYWFSPNPVDMFKSGDIYDVIGNVWQHTTTPMYPYENFQIHPIYEDFTTPTFDTLHSLIKGGSFISTGNLALRTGRYAFRRHFYQFAGFRYVISQNSTQIPHLDDQSDEKVLQCLNSHYVDKNSYIEKTLREIEKVINTKIDLKQNSRSLTVGCSVGRIPFQLTKYFEQSYGIDYTARYFQMACRLNENKQIKYKSLTVKINDRNFQPEKIKLSQFNPQNPDPNKLQQFDFVFIDGTALRNGKLANVFEKTKILMRQKCIVMVLEDKVKNQFKNVDINQFSQIQKIPIEDRYDMLENSLNLYILELSI